MNESGREPARKELPYHQQIAIDLIAHLSSRYGHDCAQGEQHEQAFKHSGVLRKLSSPIAVRCPSSTPA